MKKRTIKKTSNEDIGVTTPITYKSYVALRGQPYKNFVMLSELIDNSISSFENKFESEGKEWTKDTPLEMKMEFNFNGETSRNEEMELNYIKDSYIRVQDNGYGMDEDTLFSSLILDNGNQSLSDKNIWGRGMKQCAYFFGLDLSIRTSNGKKSYAVDQIFTNGKTFVEPYRIKPYEINNIARGTLIEIKNIYKDRCFSSESLNSVIESLEWRYIKYIKDKLIKIEYIYHDTKKGNNAIIQDQLKLRNEEILVFNNELREKITKPSLKEYISFRRSEFEEVLKSSDSAEIDKKLAENVFNEAVQILTNGIDSENDFKFEGDIKFKLNNIETNMPTSLRFKYWLIPSGKAEKIAGVRLFEGKRAITHIGTKDKDFGPWMEWNKKSDQSWRTHKRFAGTIDLSKIDAKPTVDKSKFDLPSDVFNNLKNQVFTVYRVLSIFLRSIMKKEDIVDKDIAQDFNANAIDIALKEITKNGRVNVNLEKSSYKNREVIFDYEEEENAWEIISKISETPNPVHMMSPVAIPNENNKLQITIYIKHNFWINIYKSSKKSSFVKEILSPLLLLVATSAIRASSAIGIKEPEIIVEKISEAIRGDENFG